MSSNQVIAERRCLSMGLDVDVKTSFACVVDIETGEIVYEGRIHHGWENWARFLRRLPDCRIWAYYEAGLTGFTLCRQLRSQGVDCKVVAPSQVVKAPQAKQRKNDRLDALMLAKLYWTPAASWVRVPTEQEQTDRQLIRTRDQLAHDRTRVMNRIKSLLLFYDLHPDAEIKTRWGKPYRTWLKQCGCSPFIRIALDAQLHVLEMIEQQIATVTRAIRAMNQSDRYRAATQRLAVIQGVGPLLINAFLTELFRPEQFANSKQVASHCGLTPSEWSSATTRRQGHITHWGPPHLRKLAVEAAWIWVRKDPEARKKYLSIRAGKERKIAIVAMARRLITILWSMTVNQQDYRYA